MPSVNVLDSTMFYSDQGTGAPLVFLHGNPVSSHLWRKVLLEIGQPGRCLAPDLIGMGRSGKPGFPYRFDDHARYLDAWFSEMTLGDVVLVGIDWGGSTFTGAFAGNNGGAATAYTDAYSWGNTWDGAVFSARVSVDISGLPYALAVADQVVAHIAAVMPHSPAKEGPLSRPITFDYIGDNFAGVAGRLKRTAKDNAATVSDALSGVAGVGLPAYAFNVAGLAGSKANDGGDTHFYGDMVMKIDGSGLDEAAMTRAVEKGWHDFVRAINLHQGKS